MGGLVGVALAREAGGVALEGLVYMALGYAMYELNELNLAVQKYNGLAVSPWNHQ